MRDYVCTNPNCDHVQVDNPKGHCPACKTPEGLGWSMVPRDTPASTQIAPTGEKE